MRPDTRRNLWFLAAVILLLFPLCFHGYGSDNDTFGVIEAGRTTWRLHQPTTSRNPGYWTFELIIFVLARTGGHLLTNLASLTIAIIAIWRFLVIAGRLGARFPRLVAACLIATPVFAIACTSTMDYVWSLFGLIVFAELLIADKLALAILPAALAFALRGANGAVIAGALIGAITAEFVNHRRLTPRTLKLIGVGLAAALFGSPPYIESFRAAGHSFSFLEAMAGPAAMWTTKMRIGRFAYKSLYLFGPLAWLLLAAAFTVRDTAPSPPEVVAHYRRRAFPIFGGIVLFNAILFFDWSIEISYLIPAAYFLLLVLSTTLLARTRWLTVAFLAATLSADFVTLQLAVPNIPARSTSAHLRPALKPGQLIEDIHERDAVRHCETYDCFAQRNIEAR